MTNLGDVTNTVMVLTLHSTSSELIEYLYYWVITTLFK